MIHRYKILVAHWLTNRWPWVVLFWIALAVFLKWAAPDWNSVAQDGDLQFLPATSPSRIGQRWLEENFPDHRARSQMVIIMARKEQKLRPADLVVGLDIARRLVHASAVADLRRWQADASRITPVVLRVPSREPDDPVEPPTDQSSEVDPHWPIEVQRAMRMLDEAIDLDEQWTEAIQLIPQAQSDLVDQRLAIAYWDRSELYRMLGKRDLAQVDREIALVLSPEIDQSPTWISRKDFVWSDILDVWTWRDPVLGGKLGEGHSNARMIAIQMSSDFIATSNIRFLESLESLVEATKNSYRSIGIDELEFGITGSAAIGGDMLRASAESLRRTEWVTIGLILFILTIIYRGPMLVLVPLVTIGLSLSIATSIISMLASGTSEPPSHFGLKVFTTTRIFLVVLLFGAGTDFCLFLISRCRELVSASRNRNRRTCQRSVASSWFSVHDALLGSAMTTIVGLSFMYFSNFEKFSNTGPIIGLGMAVTIMVCLTFTPALVAGLGRMAYWPFLGSKKTQGNETDAGHSISQIHRSTGWNSFWERITSVIISRPLATLLLGGLLLGIPAIKGLWNGNWVTYDFVHELSPSSPSRLGAALAKRYFPDSDDRPLTLIISSELSFADDKSWRESIEHLRKRLFVDQVRSVRSLTDPLGDYPPDRRMGLFDKDAWRRRLLENHRMTQEIYVSKVSRGAGRVARLDLLIEPNPFSLEAEKVLASVESILNREVGDPESAWYGSEFALTGTTPGIHDLKTVTQADQTRIRILVTLGVWGVLVVLLRRFWLSGYLIFTVVLSYLTTIGLSLWFFQWVYGPEFVGLDWKVPLFLFVILVAVGQDYNVYLTTRVLEEQAIHGPIRGLRRAMVMTGGIITSCGVIMAATFASMTSTSVAIWLAGHGFPAWLVGSTDTPVLRGITELGFALSLGVMIDTLIVRTIMVPAMFALLTRQGRFTLPKAS